MKGYNGTIFTYGQSGSGKTYSMLGPEEVIAYLNRGAEMNTQNIPNTI